MSVTSLAPAQRSAVAIGEVASDGRRLSEVLARPVTVRLERVSLQRAVTAVAAAAGVHVQYRRELLEGITAPITLDVKQIPLGVALEHVLAGTHLRVTPSTYGLITIEPAVDAVAIQRQGSISGKITDVRTKQPLHGAKVMVDGVDRAVTDEAGMYRVPGVEVGTHSVTVKLLGYGKAVRTVTVTDGTVVSADVALEASANTLDQVVVTGTVIQTELKAVPNAITVITAKQIEERGITKIDQLFRGDVPGVFAQNLGSAAVLDEVTMFSRGATALSSSSAGTGVDARTNPIKTYVDGIELADPKYLSQIDPKSIERIEILTGPQASTIYGSNAINGVMQIFTKRGTSNTPQLTLNLLSGWVENNFSTAHTPQHDYSAQLSGVEGRLSYNAGGSWNYMGPWTPAKQTASTGGFGGVRLDLPTPAGRVTADVTLRRSITQSLQRGSSLQTETGYRETGWYSPANASGLTPPTTRILAGQTLGFILSHSLTSWWSHELEVGMDASDAETRYAARGYKSKSDTTLLFQQDHTDRHSIRYAATTRIPVTRVAQATVTLGADGWQNVISSMTVQPQTLTGGLTATSSFTDISRQPGHNAGGFLQTQLGITNRLFLTYGLRAEWNPNYGSEAQPNYAPRYGVAYTQEFGDITTKVRASYGRSTRPPTPGSKVVQTISDIGISFFVPDYGNFDYQLANPELAPEHQQGGEGGIELYVGSRGSFVISRYNQTVDGLISMVMVDSTRSLVPHPTSYCGVPDPAGYCYFPQYENVNVGSIRNQGWELQGTMNIGSLSGHGTYSWTKSRSLGMNPKYRRQFSAQFYPQYQPGATFQFLPEHTWALGVTYAHAQTTIGLNLTGTGQILNQTDDFYLRNFDGSIRLPQNRLNMNPRYIHFHNGYALTDFSAEHRFQPRIGMVLQIQNLADRYTNDYNSRYAAMGRQGKAGFRIRW